MLLYLAYGIIVQPIWCTTILAWKLNISAKWLLKWFLSFLTTFWVYLYHSHRSFLMIWSLLDYYKPSTNLCLCSVRNANVNMYNHITLEIILGRVSGTYMHMFFIFKIWIKMIKSSEQKEWCTTIGEHFHKEAFMPQVRQILKKNLGFFLVT